MRRILSKIILLMLMTSICIASVTAITQKLTVEVNPINAGTVQVFRIHNYGTPEVNYQLLGSTRSKSIFTLETNDYVADGDTSIGTKDLIGIIPQNDLTSTYKYIKQCDHTECITGSYIGPLYPDLSEYKITAYYEIPADKESPVIVSIATSPKNPYVGDYINVYMIATDNVGIVRASVDNMEMTLGKNSYSGKIIARKGTNPISIMACDVAENCAVDNSVHYTSTEIPVIPVPTNELIDPTNPLKITKLTISNIGTKLSINISTSGNGKLGIDIDEKQVITKDVSNTDTTFSSIFDSILGTHFICAYDVNNIEEIVCDSVETKLPVTPTPTPTSTPKSQNLSVTGDYGTTSEPGITGSSLINAKLNIDSTPNNASIYINKKLVGLTPKIVEVKPGAHEIRLTKVGYEDYVTKIILKESDTTEIVAKLVKLNDTNNTNNTTINNNKTISDTTSDTTKLDENNKNSTIKDEKETDKDKILWGFILIITIILVIGVGYYKYSSTLKDGDDTLNKNVNSEVKK